jgi:Fur family ferric uptake transcriptional regulator
LQKSTTPLSHSDLIEALDGEGYDRVTLYRNLNDLAEAGLVLRTDLGDRTWRFELKGGDTAHPGGHPHFTCSDCGTVSCLPDKSVRIANTEQLPRAVRARAVEVTLRGLCDRCA